MSHSHSYICSRVAQVVTFICEYDSLKNMAWAEDYRFFRGALAELLTLALHEGHDDLSARIRRLTAALESARMYFSAQREAAKEAA